jgi:hypothetical protein
MTADLSGLMIWAHRTTRREMANGGKIAANGPVVSYKEMFSEMIKSAWRADFLRRQFGLVSAATRAAMKREEAFKARVAAQHEAAEATHRANVTAWASQLSDGQLLVAIDKAETNENPLLSSLTGNWQAQRDNSLKLEILRAESANRNQKDAA